MEKMIGREYSEQTNTERKGRRGRVKKKREMKGRLPTEGECRIEETAATRRVIRRRVDYQEETKLARG